VVVKKRGGSKSFFRRVAKSSTFSFHPFKNSNPSTIERSECSPLSKRLGTILLYSPPVQNPTTLHFLSNLKSMNIQARPPRRSQSLGRYRKGGKEERTENVRNAGM